MGASFYAGEFKSLHLTTRSSSDLHAVMLAELREYIAGAMSARSIPADAAP